jgi:hypothetical protein
MTNSLISCCHCQLVGRNVLQLGRVSGKAMHPSVRFNPASGSPVHLINYLEFRVLKGVLYERSVRTLSELDYRERSPAQSPARRPQDRDRHGLSGNDRRAADIAVAHRQESPDIRMHIESGTSDDIIRHIEAGRVNLGSSGRRRISAHCASSRLPMSATFWHSPRRARCLREARSISRICAARE